MGRTPHLNPPPKAHARDQSPDAPRRRGRPPTPPWPGVDWSLPDAEIARRRGVSREAVRVARIRYNAGPAWSKPGVAFRAYARENRARLHGKPASEALAAAGVRLYGATARRILREAGVRVAREPQPSKLRGADWRLPNPDLARIRGLSAISVANRRWELGKPKAAWDLRYPATRDDPAYLRALKAEEQRANDAAAW